MQKFKAASYVFIALAILWSTTIAQASILNVPAQYSDIQTAINTAQNGDKIIVAAGIYYENINFLGKAITVTSIDPNDPDIVEQTILDGSQPQDPNFAGVALFTSGEDPNSVLTGFTIQNGSGQSDPTSNAWRIIFTGANGDGGAILCINSSPTISKNVFKNNYSLYGGGAIYCHDSSSPTIENNTFQNNSTKTYGGAIFTRINCSPKIVDNKFFSNVCGTLGGAIYLATNSNAFIARNEFLKNEATNLSGGAIYYFINSSPSIINNVFKDNTCKQFGPGILLESSDGIIINNLFYNNASIESFGGSIVTGLGVNVIISNNIIMKSNKSGIYTFSNIGSNIKNNHFWENLNGDFGGTTPDQIGNNDNKNSDPKLLVNIIPPFTKYELEPNSPCIDAGDPNDLPIGTTIDYDKSNRIVNTIDIGPQEYNAIGVPQDHSTIQAAINASTTGDTIIVSPGIYQENVNFLNKNLKVRSLDPLNPNCVATTIIDGNQTGSCVEILDGQDDTTAIAGFYMKNGHGIFGGGVHVNSAQGPATLYNYIINCKADRYGGGIDYRSNASGLIQYNTIINNYASDAGGGIHLGPGSYADVYNNEIYNNTTPGEGGGGIYTYSKTSITIIDNIIVGNLAPDCNGGGGIWLWDPTYSIVERNIIMNNITIPLTTGIGMGRGGGLGIQDGYSYIANNIFAGNIAEEGGAVSIQSFSTADLFNNTIVNNRATIVGGGINFAFGVETPTINNIVAYNDPSGIYTKPFPLFPSDPNLIANNVWNNSGLNYDGDIIDPNGLNSNISADPQFVDNGYWDPNGSPQTDDDIWVAGDYRIGYLSPCRDTGSNQVNIDEDINLTSRPQFDDIDMGAIEIDIHDLSASGTVDISDLMLIVSNWLDTGENMPLDLNEDDIINLFEIAIISSEWFN